MAFVLYGLLTLMQPEIDSVTNDDFVPYNNNNSSGGLKGGPSRLRPPLWATDRRRHSTPDKVKTVVYYGDPSSVNL